MKIIEAINAMITNSKKISDVCQNQKEFFFLYNGKYKWSLSLTENGSYNLFLYPKEKRSVEELCNFDSEDWFNYTGLVTYRLDDIKTREAQESFSELYRILSEKVNGTDEILDDIINDNDSKNE